jgi:hypothetical protein
MPGRLRSGQSVTKPAERAAEDAATVPAAVNDCLAHVAEPVAGDDERACLGPVIDLPSLLGRPPRAGSAQGDLWVISQMHHEARFVDATATPALRWRRKLVLDSCSRRAHYPSLCLGGHRAARATPSSPQPSHASRRCQASVEGCVSADRAKARTSAGARTACGMSMHSCNAL